jgi:hypothetical protein
VRGQVGEGLWFGWCRVHGGSGKRVNNEVAIPSDLQIATCLSLGVKVV